MSISLLAGFTGTEEYVELNGMLNGRSSGSFSRGDRNVVTTLTRGTRGQVLETKKLRSGSFGIKIKVLNGKNQGDEMWVYHRDGDSDLSLYDSMPDRWDKATKSASIENAKAAKVEREKPAVADPDSVKRKSAQALQAIESINRANEEVKKSNCSNCSIAASTKEGRRTLIRPERRRYDKRGRPIEFRTITPQCEKIMSTQGKPGPLGNYLIKLMSRPGYKQIYTDPDSMGPMCPRFKSLSDSDKLLAQTWLWTALGREESTKCDPGLEHAETYVDRNGNVKILNPDIGIGIWTMEKSAAVRRENGRNMVECREVRTAEGQARCAVSIRANGNRYWGPMRGKRIQKQMMPHMERFRPCFQK
ncbi:hypothetical protein ACLVWU_13730 [Bdellovibrio sp. HCB290]|uniref:hypothetical protein n=1 Tax=Bdellovibrio sp. HCB290 TaxID=3394356 RepID=UPI0039B4B7DD